MVDKGIDNRFKLRKCLCGGTVILWGGIPSYQGYKIFCEKCGGKWEFPNIYSPVEVAERWGIDKRGTYHED